jgi:hypothetical protein
MAPLKSKNIDLGWNALHQIILEEKTNIAESLVGSIDCPSSQNRPPAQTNWEEQTLHRTIFIGLLLLIDKANHAHPPPDP